MVAHKIPIMYNSSMVNNTGAQMSTLTQAQCDTINNATTLSCDSQELFEAQNDLSDAVDLGGIVVYFNDKDLVAFYDYELDRGALV